MKQSPALRPFCALASASLLLANALLPAAASAQQQNTLRQSARSGGPVLDAAPTARWVRTWAVALSSPANNYGVAVTGPNSFTNQTFRTMCFASIGGSQVRVRISNEYGATALNLGAVHVAQRVGKGANTVAGTDRALTFGGQAAISIPPGAVVLSDPAVMNVPAASDLAVSVYLPDTAVPNVTAAPTSLKFSYIALAGTGDVTAASTFPTLGTTTNATQFGVGGTPFLAAIEVLASGAPAAIAALGDSITEGFQSTLDANAAWPNRLAVRLNGTGGPTAAVADLGIASSRLLKDMSGPSGLARFDRDVLSAPNLTYVIELFGINDIGEPGGAGPAAADPEPTVADIVQGYRQLIARAHDRGVKIMGGTLLPFKGSSSYSDAKEALRQGVNNFIRNSAEFDGLIDWDRSMAMPGDPLTLNPAYDSGDHLHPNDTGYQAMANAIDLTLFNGLVTLNSVVSRKTHGSAGTFDLPLPQGLFSTPAIESRSGGANGAYTLVFSFANPVTSILGVNVADGTGTVDSASLNPNDPTQVTVNLTGVPSGQYVTVGLTNVSDLLGNTSSVRATMGVLVGDVGANATVNAADVAQVKSLSGQSVTATNFRADINEDGIINAADVAFVKSQSGNALPTPTTNVNP